MIGRTTLVLQIPSYLQDGLENSRQQAKLTHEGAGCQQTLSAVQDELLSELLARQDWSHENGRTATI